MSVRPYHHGNLREALLAQAEVTLRERGIAALSLRELAREVGVSHAAPRRHFPDRQALLDALALSGFARLGDALGGAGSAVVGAGAVGAGAAGAGAAGAGAAGAGAAGAGAAATGGGVAERDGMTERDGGLAERLRALAHAYIAFATDAPDLLDLMFASKHGQDDEGFEQAAQAAFAPVLTLILAGQRAGVLPAGDPERVGLGQLAAIHGIASLLTVGVVSPGQVDELVDDAVARFLTGGVAHDPQG